MAETTSSRLDQREAPRREILTPEFLDQISTSRGTVAILRCLTAEGNDSGMKMYGVSLADFLASINRVDTSGGASIIDSIRSSKLANFFGKLGIAGGVMMGAAACTTTEDHKGESAYSTTYGVQKSALTSIDQLTNADVSKAQALPWSKPGDSTSNFADPAAMKGLMVANKKKGTVSYVDCSQLPNLFDCIVAATPKNIQISLAGNPYGKVTDSPAMWKDDTGVNQFSVGGLDNFNSPTTFQGKITTNATGDLEALDMDLMNEQMSDGSFFIENGVPKLLGFQGKLDLFTGALDKVNQKNECGESTFDGNVAIGSKLVVQVDGKKMCKLIAAKTIEELATNPKFLSAFDKLGDRLTEPRVISDGANGSVLVVAIGEPGGEILWAIPLSPSKVPADPDASNGDTTGDADAGTSPDVPPDVPPDVVLPPDVPTPVDDAADGTADEVDAIIIDANDPDLVEVDAEGNDVPKDVPKPPDTANPPDTNQPDATSDASQPDTDKTDATPDLIQTPKGFEVTVGDCTLKANPITQGGQDGFNIDISGNGANNAICKFTGVSLGKPVEITLSNDTGGAIQITCVTFPDINAKLNCDPGFNTFADLQEAGAGAQLHGNGVVFGSEFSHFGMVKRPDGTDEVRNAQGEAIITGKSEQSLFKDLTVPGDGKMYKVDTKIGAISEKNPAKVDAGSTDSNPENDAGNSPETQKGGDASVSAPQPAGKGKDTSCNLNPTGKPSGLAAILMATLILWNRRKKTA